MIDAQRVARGKLQEKLGSEDMKAWLRSRVVADGVMNMSVSLWQCDKVGCANRGQKLPDDLWLRDQGILPPGHENAPPQAGVVFWKLIDSVIQEVRGLREELRLTTMNSQARSPSTRYLLQATT